MSYQSVFRAGLFDGRVALVTGGGSGIGRCTAHELASLGAHVALLGRDRSKFDRVAAEIVEDGGSASAHVADIRDDAIVRDVVDDIVTARGRIDLLVNNAGGQYRSDAANISTKGFDAVLRTNLTGGFVVMREVFARSMRHHGGAIVNMIADMWFGWPQFAHSGAARAGMLNLTETVAVEWAEHGVRVNAVAPGLIQSSGLDTYEPADAEFLDLDVAKAVPLQRWGTEAEVSSAIVYLLSPAAAYVTGSCLRIDGGSPLTGGVWWQPGPAANGAEFDGFHRSGGALGAR